MSTYYDSPERMHPLIPVTAVTHARMIINARELITQSLEPKVHFQLA